MTTEFEKAKAKAHEAIDAVWDAMEGMQVTEVQSAFVEIASKAKELADDLQCDTALDNMNREIPSRHIYESA
jgi:hypothetical protein